VAVARGVPVPLDSTTMPSAAACPGQAASLEVRYDPRPITADLSNRLQAVAGGGVGSGGGRGGGVVNVGASGAGTSSGGGGVFTVGRAGNAGTSDFRPYRRVTLWLVHTAPGVSDE